MTVALPHTGPTASIMRDPATNGHAADGYDWNDLPTVVHANEQKALKGEVRAMCTYVCWRGILMARTPWSSGVTMAGEMEPVKHKRAA